MRPRKPLLRPGKPIVERVQAARDRAMIRYMYGRRG